MYFIILPIYILALPFVVIIKTIFTIWQPYFYKVSHRDYEEEDDRWNERYQECLQKSIYIDYLTRRPKYGTFLGIASWGQIRCPINSNEDLIDFELSRSQTLNEEETQEF